MRPLTAAPSRQAVVKALEQLAQQGKIREKTYGKQKIYFAGQVGAARPSPGPWGATPPDRALLFHGLHSRAPRLLLLGPRLPGPLFPSSRAGLALCQIHLRSPSAAHTADAARQLGSGATAVSWPHFPRQAAACCSSPFGPSVSAQ